MLEAQNNHDVDAMVEYIAPDYRSETPQHPSRNFTGREQLREAYVTLFETTPDYEIEVLRLTEDDETVWVELHATGIQTDGTNIDLRGVAIFGVSDGQIQWGRNYMAPVEHGGETWNEFYAVEDE